MKLSIIKPYSDSKMEWNESLNRYVLTIEAFKDNCESHYRNDQMLLQRLKKNTKKIYNFIRYRGYSSNWIVTEFLLNRTKEGREFLFETLMSQMEADNESAFNDLSSSPAVNVTNGQVIDREQLSANQISVDTEQMIEDSASFFGVPITLRTNYPWEYFMLWRNNK